MHSCFIRSVAFVPGLWLLRRVRRGCVASHLGYLNPFVMPSRLRGRAAIPSGPYWMLLADVAAWVPAGVLAAPHPALSRLLWCAAWRGWV